MLHKMVDSLDGAVLLARASTEFWQDAPEDVDTLLDVLLAEIEIGFGRPRAALRYLQGHRAGALAGLADVSRGRAQLALGDLDSARRSARNAASATGQQVSRYVLVDAMLLDAQIASQAGDPGRAVEMITRALDVAHGDLVLPFARAGESLAGLLVRHPSVAARWPAGPPRPHSRPPLNTAIPNAPSPRRAGEVPPRLTQREQAILTYLPTSLTAGEIAGELYLSVNTVKTHLAAIYRKLGTGGRRAAVRRASELELL